MLGRDQPTHELVLATVAAMRNNKIMKIDNVLTVFVQAVIGVLSLDAI